MQIIFDDYFQYDSFKLFANRDKVSKRNIYICFMLLGGRHFKVSYLHKAKEIIHNKYAFKNNKFEVINCKIDKKTGLIFCGKVMSFVKTDASCSSF